MASTYLVRAGRSGIQFQVVAKDFSLRQNSSGLTVRLTQPHRESSRGKVVKRPDRSVDHAPLYNTEVKEGVEVQLCLSGSLQEIFTFVCLQHKR